MKTIKLFQLLVLVLFISLTNCSPEDDTSNNDNDPIITNAIDLACVIDTDTMLNNHSEGVDYIVDCDLDIKSFVTIEPGTTIAFKSNASIYVDTQGALQAIGTSSNPITFKGKQNISGFWKGIGFESNDVRNELNYVTIADAGSSPINATWHNNKAAVVIYKTLNTGKLTLQNSTIENTDGIGLVAMSIADLRTFNNNTFKNNTNYAVRVSAKHVKEIDANSTYTNNGFNGVSIRESKLNASSNHTWQGLNYLIDGKIDIRDGLKILPDAHFQFTANGYMRAEGNNAHISALGTATNKITFTGEVNTNGAWKGIYFFDCNNIQNVFSNCVISYGGSDSHTFVSNKANLTLFNGSKVEVKNSSITNSGGCGIIIGNSTITGWSQCLLINNNNLFTNNNNSNICYQD